MLRFPFMFLALICGLFWPDSASAQSQNTDIRPKANRIIGDALLDEFIGITHKGAYNFTDDGEPRRFYAETHHDDGRVTYTEEGQSFGGVWIIKREALCYVYKDPSMSGGCFRVYKVGNCFYFYTDLLPERSDELDRDYWTARSVKAGEAPNCEPGLS